MGLSSPPRLERTTRRIRVVFHHEVIVDTRRAWRVLETSHPPVYYLPPEEFAPEVLVPSNGGSYCEWKGRAGTYSIRAGGRMARDAAWSYDRPTAGFMPIQGYVAISAGKMDACYVDDEEVAPQPGEFYGGWITGDVVGPFKGVPGSSGW